MAKQKVSSVEWIVPVNLVIRVPEFSGSNKADIHQIALMFLNRATNFFGSECIGVIGSDMDSESFTDEEKAVYSVKTPFEIDLPIYYAIIPEPATYNPILRQRARPMEVEIAETESEEQV